MLRKLLSMFVGAMALALVLGSGVVAEDKKDEKKTLQGSLVCTKCELKETKACGHALLVKEKGKDGKETEVKYYFLNDKGAKETFHKEICGAPKDATVTGKVTEKKEKDVTKKYIEDYKVEYKK